MPWTEYTREDTSLAKMCKQSEHGTKITDKKRFYLLEDVADKRACLIGDPRTHYAHLLVYLILVIKSPTIAEGSHSLLPTTMRGRWMTWDAAVLFTNILLFYLSSAKQLWGLGFFLLMCYMETRGVKAAVVLICAFAFVPHSVMGLWCERQHAKEISLKTNMYGFPLPSFLLQG